MRHVGNISEVEYRQLQREYYDRLRATGFVDIERWGGNGDTDFLAGHFYEARRVVKRGRRTGGEAFAEVFQAWVLSRTWPTRLQRLAAACMAQGVAITEIPVLCPRPIPALKRLTAEWRAEVVAWNAARQPTEEP